MDTVHTRQTTFRMYLFYNPLVGSWQNQSSSTSILIRPSIKKPPAPSAFQIPSPVKPSAGVNWIAPIFGILARSTLVRKGCFCPVPVREREKMREEEKKKKKNISRLI
ncbi:hypothetical protein TRIATDRAFT_92922 [Trichoderma atroviride IMI 206040]|uniref:Uncharacterized protein n=1 Tax=Hypocrea atroviridis (strain ATCC 20476 / IMI 206040) TaxID=452589 RepID=G9NH75_HYPAI|nr:uncharacterized protein TRIATDRAFT_92922 [Trichoderma atroviride IMI 206040]EHK49970.1 hypothetical protein TRIATDRAFT_92922 [Trichoderma atroviride IMI 206040]